MNIRDDFGSPKILTAMIVKIFDAIISRLVLVILIIMIGTVVGVLLFKSPGGGAGGGRVERSLQAP
ncbi:hypothetical protein [Rhizobium sp. BK376]|uniref:hypothetical protein n=1 Tax=Rhizobium sp. BK376 TaxID=2512149 RepID=UPI001049A527|nr:hypothetical protein [Rhizobium sp. BK376]TCR76658.1 hypothetical protein EV561_12016 [Rhizobium sp. BK376]